MNNTSNQTASSNTSAESSILNTKFDLTGTDQGAVSYLQIVCLIVFSIQLVVFLVILKKYILKFVSFFILRKDYQNLHVLDISDHNGLDNGINSFGNRQSHNESGSLNGKSKIRQCCTRFRQRLTQHIHTYHPLASLALLKFHHTIAIKLPLHVMVWSLLACIILTLSLTIIIAQLVQSKCLDKRYYAASSYQCKQTTPTLLTMQETLITSLFIAIICVALSIVGIFRFSKNYFSFLQKFSEFNNRKSNSEEIDSSPMYNKQTDMKQHLPTQQNMLEDGSDYTRRSVRSGALPPINEFSAYKTKGLFQINEADNDEECNSQRSISDNGKSHKKDDKRPSMIKKNNRKGNDSKTQRDIEDPFNNSNYVNNENINDSNNNYSQKLHALDQQHIIGSANKNKLLDSTTLDGPKQYNLESPPDNKKKIPTQDRIDLEQDSSPNKDLKKMEDTQRISMVPQKQIHDDEDVNLVPSQPQSKNNFCLKILYTIIMIAIIVLFVLGLLLDGYAFFNMTHNAILQVLKIFGLALALDFFLIRFIGILFVSLASTIKDIINKVDMSKYSYDRSQLDALGQIYKGYHQNVNQYVPITSQDQAYNGPSSECDSDEQLLGKKNRQPSSHQYDPETFGGLRFIKLIGPSDNKNRPASEILLVEPTYFNNRSGPNNLLDNGGWNDNENANSRQNKKNKKGEVMQVTAINFNNNHNGENLKVNYEPNEDILNSSNSIEPDFRKKKTSSSNDIFNQNKSKDQSDDTFEIGKGKTKSNQVNATQFPSIFNKNNRHREIEDMEMNSNKNKQTNSSLMYPAGQSISYNNQFGVDSQGSPLQDQDFNNMSDASNIQKNKLNQDQMYPTGHLSYQNGALQNDNRDDQDQYGNLYTTNKLKMSGKVFLPNGFALFNLPLFNGIWGKGKNDKKNNADWNLQQRKKTLGQLVNGGGRQFYNFPSVVQDAENKLNMVLTPDNNLFRTVKKNSKGEIQIIDSTQYHNLPFMKLEQSKIQQKPISINKTSGKNKVGEEVVINSSQSYNGPHSSSASKQNQSPEYNLQLSDQKKNSFKRGVIEIDSTMLYSLPLFQPNQKLTNDEANAKKQLLKLIGKNKQNGEIIEVDETKFYNLPMFNGKSNLSPEMQNLQLQLNSTLINKPSRDIIEIDSTLLFSLPLFQNSSKLTSDQANAKKQILQLVGRNKQSGEIIEVDATKFYNLPMFSAKSSQSPDMQNLQSQLTSTVKNKTSRDVVEIDSTYLYSLPMFQSNDNLTKEAQQFKSQILSLMGNKQPAPGEIIQIDSTQFYNLPIFQGSANLTPELENLQSQIKQSVKRKAAPGEIVQIDSTMLANLSMFAENANLSAEAQEIKRQILTAIGGTKKLANGEIVQIDSSELFNLTLFQEGKAQLTPELQELTRQLLSVIKRKTTTGEVVGVDATYIIDLSNNMHMNTKQQQKELYEESKENQGQKSLHSLKKKKTNRAFMQGVSSQIIYDANNDQQPLKVTPLEKIDRQQTQINSQAELNELIHDGRERNIRDTTQKVELPLINTSFYLPPINNVRSQMFETPDGQSKGISRNEFENSRVHIELNESKNLEDLIEKQENRKRIQNSSAKKFDAEDKENSNISNIPLKLNGDNKDTIDQQDQLILEKQGSYSPQYNSNAKKDKKKKIKVKKNKEAFKFEDDILHSNENDGDLSNIIKDKMDIVSPINTFTDTNLFKAQVNESDQSFLGQTSKKEKMNLENFIKPNIPKIKKKKQNKIMHSKEDVTQQQVDNTYSSNGKQNFDKQQEFDQSVININDTNRSKVYEDSDNSTYRMISFSKNKQQVPEAINQNLAPTNFYLNEPIDEPVIEKQSSQKVFEMIEEDNVDNQQTQFEQKRSSKNQRRGQVQILESDQEDIDILGDLMQGRAPNQDDFKSVESDINDLKFTKRKQLKMPKKQVSRQESNRSSSSKESKSQRSYNNENPQLSINEQLRQKKEKKDKIQERLNEQKRKLNHFLKLAQQMKSVADENKINELLEVLTTTKKPLAMSKINELKLLEMMSSPYNQSLTAMIKDEAQFYKKKKGGDATNKNQRAGKSQQRTDQNHQEKLSKLGGIYGGMPQQRNKNASRKNSSENSFGEPANDIMKNKKVTSILDQAGIKGSKRQIREKSQKRADNNVSLGNQNEMKNMSSLAFNSSDDDFIAKPQVISKKRKNQEDQNNIQDLE